MHSLDGQGENGNIFKYPLTNRLPPANHWFIRSVETALALGNLRLRELSIDHLATSKRSGSDPTHLHAPWKLIFEPTGSHGFSPETVNFRRKLSQINPGTTLYKIYAIEHQGASPEFIGQITTTSNFAAASFADERLFFQHGPN